MLTVLAVGLFGAGKLRAAEVGETKVLKWKDGKEAVFMLAFDDSCPTHITNVIPELEKRGIVGNFYIVPGKGTFPPLRLQWSKAVNSPVVAIQNHTFTHVGAKTPEQLDEELAKCNEAIKTLMPEKKWPRLIGWGKPGGVPFEVAKEEVERLLVKNNLVDRPPFWGPPIHQKSAAECVAAIDKALKDGEMGHLDMHGVGGDWLVTPMDWFTAILDKLQVEKDRLWVTDVVSYTQYKAEREQAAVKVLQVVSTGVRLEVSAGTLDVALFDLPLSLETVVPMVWRWGAVTLGETDATVPVSDGVVRYEAVPGGGEVRLVAK